MFLAFDNSILAHVTSLIPTEIRRDLKNWMMFSMDCPMRADSRVLRSAIAIEMRDCRPFASR